MTIDESSPRQRATAHVQWLPIIFISAIIALLGFGYFASTAAQLRLFEAIICERYYLDNPIILQAQLDGVPENICKIVPVQEALAELQGWQSFFEGLPGLLLAVPYGVAADRYGRRLVLVASMLGMFLWSTWILFICWAGLPIKLIWLSSVFLTIGGGSTVAAAISMTILIDATPESTRSRMFFYFEAMNIALALVVPPLGAFLMEQDVWIPLLFQLGCSFAAFFLAFCVPETRSADSDGCRQLDQEVERPTSVDADNDEDNPKLLGNAFAPLLSHFSNTAAFVAHDRSIMLLIFTFLINSFVGQSLSLILQYVSQRFHWTLAEASYLLSFRGGVQLLFYVAILPGIDAGLARWLSISAQQKNLKLARFSIVILVASFTIISFSYQAWMVVAGLALYTLGSGLGTFTRSLISSLVDQKMLGTLYTILSIMETSGTLLAGPVIAKAFKSGMRLDGIWVGMPYMVSTVLLAVCSLLIFFVRLPGKSQNDEEPYDRLAFSDGSFDEDSADGSRESLLPK